MDAKDLLLAWQVARRDAEAYGRALRDAQTAHERATEELAKAGKALGEALLAKLTQDPCDDGYARRMNFMVGDIMLEVEETNRHDVLARRITVRAVPVKRVDD